MTAEQWLVCEDPHRMLEFLGSRVSERKFRLFACTCIRRARRLLTPRYLKAIEASEGYADGEIEIAELMGERVEVARLAARSFRRYRARPWSICVQRQFARVAVVDATAAPLGDMLTFSRECWVVARSQTKAEGKRRKELQARCVLLRDLFNNPLHSLTISSAIFSWHDSAVVRLAQAAYEERILPDGTLDNTRLAVLADALEEAGCTDEHILTHLRGGGEHYRGCFVVDALLGKE